MNITVNEVVDGTFEVTIGGVDMLVDIEVDHAYDYEVGTEERYRYRIAKGDVRVFLDEGPIRITRDAEVNIKRAINNYLAIE